MSLSETRFEIKLYGTTHDDKKPKNIPSTQREKLNKNIMKAKNLCLLIGIILAFLACSKEKNIPNIRITARDIQVTKQLRNFQQSLLLKSTNPMNLEDADWHIEGLLNLEKAYNYHNFVSLQFKTDSIMLLSSNGMISGEQIEQAYEYFANLLDSYSSNQGNAFGFDIIDILSEETEMKDGSVIMYMESASGDEAPFNYDPFTEDDYWYWGWGMGKCDAYQGQGVGSDATDKLEYKFNHPNAALGPGYFTSNESKDAYPWDYPDASNPGPYGDCMIFMYDSYIQPPQEPCLSPTELNYYLSKFDYIKSDLQPSGKTLESVEVVDDIVLGTASRLHWYYLIYGIFTLHDED